MEQKYNFLIPESNLSATQEFEKIKSTGIIETDLQQVLLEFPVSAINVQDQQSPHSMAMPKRITKIE